MELGSLIRSFQLERPPQRKIAPQWNLSLVLQSLLKPPFEPIAKCELKFLTLKTVFLVALASGRRRSELHALCFDSHHFRQNQDQSMVTLYPDLDFVAKNQALDAVAEPIKLSAFTSVGGADARLECGVYDRLHIYPLFGIFYFPWHRHQIEAFTVYIRKTERFTISNVESQVFTPNNSRLDPGSNPGCPRDKRMSYHWTNCASLD